MKHGIGAAGITRRRFLQSGLVGAGVAGFGLVAPLSSVEPVPRSGKSLIHLGLSVYSYRDQIMGKDKANPMTLEQVVDKAEELGCDGVEFTCYYFKPDPTNEYFVRLKRQVFLKGMTVCGMPIRTDFSLPPGDKRKAGIVQCKKWIERAAVLGAPCVRIFSGGDLKRDVDEQRGLILEGLKECLNHAEKFGVMLAMENHGVFTDSADKLLAIVERVESDWFGVNLDTGNFRTPDPYADIQRCLPYAVVSQVKTDIFRMDGKRVSADLKRVVRLFREAGYRGFMSLEYEGAEPAAQAVPKHIAELQNLLRT